MLLAGLVSVVPLPVGVVILNTGWYGLVLMRLVSILVVPEVVGPLSVALVLYDGDRERLAPSRDQVDGAVAHTRHESGYHGTDQQQHDAGTDQQADRPSVPLELSAPLVFDSYRRNRLTGSLILNLALAVYFAWPAKTRVASND